MEIINLTPHEITLCGEKIKPSGYVARATTSSEVIGEIELNNKKIPLKKITYGDLVITNANGEELELKEDGTIYIVSSLAYAAKKDIKAKLVTLTDFVRDEKGNIIEARSLSE